MHGSKATVYTIYSPAKVESGLHGQDIKERHSFGCFNPNILTTCKQKNSVILTFYTVESGLHG